MGHHFAKIKSFDKNLGRMILRAYTRHKLWSTLTLKNASPDQIQGRLSAMPRVSTFGQTLAASLRSCAPPDAADATSTARR